MFVSNSAYVISNAGRLFHLGYDYPCLGGSKNGREPFRFLRPKHAYDRRQIDSEHLLIKKQYCVEGYVLRRGSYLFLSRQIGQMIPNFIDAHLSRMPLVIKQNIIANTSNVRPLSLAAHYAANASSYEPDPATLAVDLRAFAVENTPNEAYYQRRWRSSIVGHISFDRDRIMIKGFHIVIGICFFASTLLLLGACSIIDSAAQTSNQNSDVPAIVKVDRSNPDFNGRVYNSKTVVVNKDSLKNLDCNNQNGYNLAQVENHHEDEGITSRDLNIVVGDMVVVKIEIPTASEVKNFRLVSGKKTKNGFQMNTDWGGGNFHYEIQFSFRCRENNFYLYKVKKDSFSTTNSDAEYWDKKETEEIKANLPIEKFVLNNYL